VFRKPHLQISIFKNQIFYFEVFNFFLSPPPKEITYVLYPHQIKLRSLPSCTLDSVPHYTTSHHKAIIFKIITVRTSHLTTQISFLTMRNKNSQPRNRTDKIVAFITRKQRYWLQAFRKLNLVVRSTKLWLSIVQAKFLNSDLDAEFQVLTFLVLQGVLWIGYQVHSVVSHIETNAITQEARK